MIEGQVLLSLYTSLITWQLGRHNVFNTSPCCQYVFTNSPRRRQWSSWCCQWSSVHRQEVVSDRQRSWPSCQQTVICTFMCCHWGVNRSSIRRQANHLAMYWRCTGDFWWISSREDGASASPDVASWCERGCSGHCYWGPEPEYVPSFLGGQNVRWSACITKHHLGHCTCLKPLSHCHVSPRVQVTIGHDSETFRIRG